MGLGKRELFRVVLVIARILAGYKDSERERILNEVSKVLKALPYSE